MAGEIAGHELYEWLLPENIIFCSRTNVSAWTNSIQQHRKRSVSTIIVISASIFQNVFAEDKH